ncbi:MAG: hypothetical protein HDQ97_09105 [Lachnospiraceae bacterium]|nr:hypothetical protein [Lachnospiraceae bacterium]
MGLVDLFAAEDKIELNFKQLHGLTTKAVKHDLLMNGIKCDVPHKFLREVMTGEKEEGIQVTGITCHMPDPEEIHKALEAARREAKRQAAAGQQEGDAGQQAQEEGVRVGEVKLYERKQRRRDWADIQKTIQEGNAAEFLPGTEIHFTLKDGRPAKAVVIGINHYNMRDAVFRIVEPLTFAGMNKEHTNAGGWHDCEARRLLNEDFFPLLPDELQAVIVKHDTNQKINGKRTLSDDFLFLPSEFEVMGCNRYAEYNDVDKVFDYLKERINRLIVDEEGDLRAFWTADPSAANTTHFCYFGYGNSNYTGAANDLALAPLFVIE